MERETSLDPQQALEAISQSRREMADRLAPAWWYYPLIGALLAQMVLAYGFLDGVWPVLSALLVALASGRLLKHYFDRTGITTSWPRGMRGRLALVAWFVLLVGPILWLTVASPVSSALTFAMAVYMFAAVCGLGWMSDLIVRADLRRSVV